jgi:hypothetical protein
MLNIFQRKFFGAVRGVSRNYAHRGGYKNPPTEGGDRAPTRR